MGETLRLLKVTVIVIIVFSIIFSMFDYSHYKGIDKEDDKNCINRFLNRAYFTTSTLSSVGYGDIVATSKEVRVIVMAAQIVVIVNVLGYFSS